eukprot:6741711-Pyramimonas_sp.AAC.1
MSPAASFRAPLSPLLRASTRRRRKRGRRRTTTRRKKKKIKGSAWRHRDFQQRCMHVRAHPGVHAAAAFTVACVNIPPNG